MTLLGTVLARQRAESQEWQDRCLKMQAEREARAALAPEVKPKHASYCGDSRGPDPLCGGCGMPWPALEVK